MRSDIIIIFMRPEWITQMTLCRKLFYLLFRRRDKSNFLFFFSPKINVFVNMCIFVTDFNVVYAKRKRLAYVL